MIDLRSLRVVAEECSPVGDGVVDKVSHSGVVDKVIEEEVTVEEATTAEVVELSDN